MSLRVAIVDTNVVVAGLLTRNLDSPPARILDGMLGGRFPFVVSEALLAEYRAILLRGRIHDRHGLTVHEVDALLTTLVANAMVRNPPVPRASETTAAAATAGRAPDAGDQHLSDLLAAVPRAVLVTGDAVLIEHAADPARVLTPRQWTDHPPHLPSDAV